MGNPFKSPPKPKVQKVAEAPPPAERTDAETAALEEEQRKKFAGGTGGRASTFLSGGNLSEAVSAVRNLGGTART